MTSFELPQLVRAAFAQRLEGVARRDLAARARRISDAYRSGKPSSAVVASAEDALAYALVRMPATYAAVRAALASAAPHLPAVSITSAVDFGAGTASATAAALEQWPQISRVSLIEPNRCLAALARLHLDAGGLAVTVHAADAARRLDVSGDIALASYVQIELAAAERTALVRNALSAAGAVAVFVEPGTPAGFECIRATRDLIAGSGWHIAAPCPHAQGCPLTAPDWCHFKVRLPRSRDHKQVKGTDVPYEDEPHSYVVATREPPAPAPARVLRVPVVTKAAVDLAVCATEGRRELRVPRSAPLYRSARKAEPGEPWGR